MLETANRLTLRPSSIGLVLWLLAGLAASAAGGERLKIYIVTDLEGASGVYQFSQTREVGPLNESAKEYLMGDIAAAIPECKPYKLTVPIQAKKEYLVFDDASKPGRKVTKEGAIEDVLKLFEF